MTRTATEAAEQSRAPALRAAPRLRELRVLGDDLVGDDRGEHRGGMHVALASWVLG
jgi:hypothetical protein